MDICYHCFGSNLVRRGLANNGAQRWLCKDCGRYCREEGRVQFVPRQLIPLLISGFGTDCAKADSVGVHRNTIARWRKKLAVVSG